MDINKDTSPFLTRLEAAAFLKVSPYTLTAWGVKGFGPTFYKVGRRAVYRLDELEAWALSHAKQAA